MSREFMSQEMGMTDGLSGNEHNEINAAEQYKIFKEYLVESLKKIPASTLNQELAKVNDLAQKDGLEDTELFYLDDVKKGLEVLKRVQSSNQVDMVLAEVTNNSYERLIRLDNVKQVGNDKESPIGDALFQLSEVVKHLGESKPELIEEYRRKNREKVLRDGKNNMKNVTIR